jgi:exonuclease SbcC
MLQSVELENFLSHKNTKLTFDRGVTVFVGPNGVGKSSIIDAVTFALFGEHIRKTTKGLLRRGSNQAYTKVEFSIGSRQFEAVRKIDSKGTVGAVLNEKINDGLIPLAAGERKQFGESMTKTIESLIGLDFEKLKVASIVQQGELQAIIEADPKKFKELINAIIGIDKLDIAYESMRKITEHFRTTVRSRLDYDDTNIDMLEKRIDILSKEIKLLEPQKNKLEEDKALQEYEFIRMQQEIESEAPKELKIKEIQNKKDDLLKYLRNSISTIKREIIEKERKLSECTDSLSIVSLRSQVESDIIQAQLEIDRIQQESKEAGEKMAMIRSQQDLVNRLHLVDGKCPVCDSKVDKLNPLFEEEHLRSELDILKNKIEVLAKDDTIVRNKKREHDLKLQQIIKAEGVLSLNNIRSQNDLITLREEVRRLQVNVKDIPFNVDTKSLKQYSIDEYSIDVINSISVLVEDTQDFDINKFSSLKTKLEQHRKILSVLDQDIGAVNTKLNMCREESGKIALVLSELYYVKQYISSLETIRSQIYNRDGPVAVSLRSWALSTISQKASEYLAIFNVKIQRISLEEKTRDLVITCHSGNLELDLESLSGGEKVSVALALRLGMAHLMGSSNLNLIILDEPTTHLDQERRKSLVNVLSQAFESNIDTISQFIIITHDSDIFENSNIDVIYDFNAGSEGTIVTRV